MLLVWHDTCSISMWNNQRYQALRNLTGFPSEKVRWFFPAKTTGKLSQRLTPDPFVRSIIMKQTQYAKITIEIFGAACTLCHHFGWLLSVSYGLVRLVCRFLCGIVSMRMCDSTFSLTTIIITFSSKKIIIVFPFSSSVSMIWTNF